MKLYEERRKCLAIVPGKLEENGKTLYKLVVLIEGIKGYLDPEDNEKDLIFDTIDEAAYIANEVNRERYNLSEQQQMDIYMSTIAEDAITLNVTNN